MLAGRKCYYYSLYYFLLIIVYTYNYFQIYTGKQTLRSSNNDRMYFFYATHEILALERRTSAQFPLIKSV